MQRPVTVLLKCRFNSARTGYTAGGTETYAKFSTVNRFDFPVDSPNVGSSFLSRLMIYATAPEVP